MKDLYALLLAPGIAGCNVSEVETRIVKQHITSSGDQINIKYASGHATANENIQIWKKTDHDTCYIQVFQRYDSLVYSKLLNDSTLKIIIWNSTYRGNKPDTILVDLSKTIYDAKRYTDSIERLTLNNSFPCYS